MATPVGERKRLLTGLAFCSPVIIGLLLFMAYPILASLVYSFCRYSVLRPPKFVATANYAHPTHEEMLWTCLADRRFPAPAAADE